MRKICAVLLLFCLILALCACQRISEADISIFLTEWSRATGSKEDLLSMLVGEVTDGKTVYELPLTDNGDTQIILTLETNDSLDLTEVTLSATGRINDSVRTEFDSYFHTVIDVFTRQSDDAAQIIEALHKEGYRTDTNTYIAHLKTHRFSYDLIDHSMGLQASVRSLLLMPTTEEALTLRKGNE